MKLKFLLLFIFIIIVSCFLIINNKKQSIFKFFDKKTKNNESTKIILKNSLKHRCNLFEEIIDRNNLDNERQCFYNCGDKIIERVDTSIEYPCQKYILENK